MKELEIVGPLMLVGRNGQLKSAQGMKWNPDPNASPYQEGDGPFYTGARLIPLGTDGETGPQAMNQAAGAGYFPNSGADLYGGEDIENLYRLRLFYSGGMTPDGLLSLQPGMFDDYFTLIFTAGQELSTANEPMTIGATTTNVTVLGLADVGMLQQSYDTCYVEDRDNYQDIILRVQGNPAMALQRLTSVRAFDKGTSLFNPGGPGPTPFDGVAYTVAAPPQTIDVNVDLNRMQEATYCVHQDGTVSTTISECILWSQTNVLKVVPYGGTPTSGDPIDNDASGGGGNVMSGSPTSIDTGHMVLVLG